MMLQVLCIKLSQGSVVPIVLTLRCLHSLLPVCLQICSHYGRLVYVREAIIHSPNHFALDCRKI